MVDVGGKDGHGADRGRHRPGASAAPHRPMLVEGRLPKGDALATARLAGIMAAKRTPDLIPLCHVIALAGVEVAIDVDAETGAWRSPRRPAADRTGVEMEALVAASTAALTLYDMTKAVERGAVIEHVRLESKTGGKSGDWHRPMTADGSRGEVEG
jgi:cyclic pyranopterin monophosphate synthase